MTKEYLYCLRKRINELDDKYIALFAYLFCIAIRAMINLPFAVPYTTGDEYLMLALPMKMAGVDWQNVLDNYYRYYGVGLSIFSYPLLLNRVPMSIVYRLLVVIEIAIGSLTVLFSYFTLRVFFVVNKYIAFSLAMSAGFLTSIPYVYIYNETIYSAWVWGAFFIMLCMANYRKRSQQAVFSIIYILLFVLALAVHQRAITIIVVYVAIYILFYLIYKKKLGFLLFILISSIAAYKLNSKFIEWQYNYLFPNTHTGIGEIKNVSVDVNIRLSSVFRWEYVLNGLRTLLGQFTVLNFLFVGLAFFVVVYGAFFLLYEKTAISMNYWLVFVYGIICIVVTIGGQYNTNAADIIKVFENKNYYSDAIRILYYHRYIYPYFSPIFICTIALIGEYITIDKKKINKYMLIMTLLSLLWIKCISVYAIGNSTYTASTLKGIIEAYTLGIVKAKKIDFIQVAIVLLIIFAFVWGILRIKQRRVFVYGVMLAIIILRSSLDVDAGISKLENHYSRVDKLVEFLEYAPDNIESLKFYSYVNIVEETSQGLGLILQVNHYKYPFIFHYPSEEDDEALVFEYNGETNDKLIGLGYNRLSLSQNQCVYYKGEKAERIINETYSKWKLRDKN
ncbi:hypothetical protein [Butyrivibrio sp. VCD2006]|uniref:hypothetical protein n=1 Tax=Butyrivibrio sp. VCD2006 TaxID=1280664 RepID=UPI000417D74D|nr:hypothetical protein [Butyrivibrio sp. VCD2006]